jgi:hypothetical protein
MNSCNCSYCILFLFYLILHDLSRAKFLYERNNFSNCNKKVSFLANRLLRWRFGGSIVVITSDHVWLPYRSPPSLLLPWGTSRVPT